MLTVLDVVTTLGGEWEGDSEQMMESIHNAVMGVTNAMTEQGKRTMVRGLSFQGLGRSYSFLIFFLMKVYSRQAGSTS